MAASNKQSGASGPAGPSIVRMTGFGVDRPTADNEIPIDINYAKLVDWLNSRKKLPPDWHKRVAIIQSSVTAAVKELPAGLLTQLPGGADAPMDYFRCRMVRDKLAETADRSLFGGLTGTAGVWDKIVKAYEKDYVYVGEAAQAMMQNVDFEIPYLRKQAAKFSQQIADGEKRDIEYNKSAATCAANYKQECAKLGIPGVAVKQELRSLTSQVPGLLEALLATLRQQQLGDAVSYYAQFTGFAHQQAKGGSGSSSGAAAVLGTLQEVRDGTTTLPDHLKGAPAAAGDANNEAGAGISWDIGAADEPSKAAEAAAGSTAVNWDLGDLTMEAAEPSSSAGAAGISWDLTAEDTAAGAGEAAATGPAAVDWGISMDDAGGSSGAAAAGGAPNISWDIELTEAAAEGSSGGIKRDWGSAADLSKPAASSGAQQQEAAVLRLERDSDYRALLQDDLQELRAFLLHRGAELKGGGSGSDLLHTLLPPQLQEVDAAGVGRMLGVVEGALTALNNPELRQLQLIAGSQRYLERLASSLQRKQGQEAKMLAAAAEARARQREARAQLAAATPKVAELVGRTKVQKAEVEGAISKMLSGRRVNILGEINNVLAAGA